MQNIIINILFIEAFEVEISEKIMHKQLPLNQVNQVVDVVLLASAGFTTEGEKVPTKAVQLFTRQAVVQLWNHLEKILDQEKSVFITGDPGCGKSCVVWSWCCYKVTKGKTVLWIHTIAHEKSPRRVLLLNGFNDEDRTFMGSTYILKNSLPKADILVLDGITADNITETFPLVDRKKYSSTFVVSSQQLQLKSEEAILTKYMVHCWEKEDFIDAVKNEALLKWIRSTPDVLPNSGTVEEIVDFKYFYAGRSARWMFQYSIDQVKVVIGDYIDRCPDFDALAAGMSGTQSKEAINHLISKLPNKTVDLISLYATQQLLKKINSKSVVEAKNLLSRYPTCLGFLFEIVFLIQIRQGPLQFKGLDGKLEIWGYNDQYTLDEFSSKDISTCAENDWIIPNWNQQAYDFVQIYELINTASTPQIKLRFVQLTKASSHKFNPSPVQDFITEIGCRAEVTDVDFVFVIPDSKLSKFKVISAQTQFTVNMGKKVSTSHEFRILGWSEN